jgi:hypothetical protein
MWTDDVHRSKFGFGYEISARAISEKNLHDSSNSINRKSQSQHDPLDEYHQETALISRVVRLETKIGHISTIAELRSSKMFTAAEADWVENTVGYWLLDNTGTPIVTDSEEEPQIIQLRSRHSHYNSTQRRVVFD